jgi:hypothetical protein
MHLAASPEISITGVVKSYNKPPQTVFPIPVNVVPENSPD